MLDYLRWWLNNELLLLWEYYDNIQIGSRNEPIWEKYNYCSTVNNVFMIDYVESHAPCTTNVSVVINQLEKNGQFIQQ